MALKPCLDCGTLSTGTRCPAHTALRHQAREQRRGTRQQRGLDATYDRNRKLLMALAEVCAVCGRPGTDGDPLTAGHIIGRAQGGTNEWDNLRAEHASYNYSQGKGCREQATGGYPATGM